VSAHRSRGVLRGEVAWGMTWRGKGPVPHCLGWLRVVRGPKKSLGCKRWIAIGLSLLRFL